MEDFYDVEGCETDRCQEKDVHSIKSEDNETYEINLTKRFQVDRSITGDGGYITIVDDRGKIIEQYPVNSLPKVTAVGKDKETEEIEMEFNSIVKEILKPLAESNSKCCNHQWVNVGFSALKMVCKKCNMEKPKCP